MSAAQGSYASDAEPVVSTGRLPSPEVVRDEVTAAWERYRGEDAGEVASYIPALARARRDAFGIAVAGVNGQRFGIGDDAERFSIQSVSKPFVFALVCEALGPGEARAQLGVNATGLPFNSVMAIELHAERTINPLVNAGAIAATSLVPGDTLEAKWRRIVDGLSAFAGRRLAMDEEVYASEAATNQRNRGIAELLDSYRRIGFDPLEATDLYTRQCALAVSAQDLAAMGATLAGGGVNPLTGERVVRAEVAARVLAVLATAGLYERSGDWLYDVGLPGKSGVSGGIVTIAPGKGAVGTWSPPLDAAGNSVRGCKAMARLSRRLGLDLFASAPAERGVAAPR